MEQKNPVTWFEIYVEDMDRAKKFYETVLAQPLSEMPTSSADMQMIAFPWVEGSVNTSGALVKHEMGKPGSGGTVVYFASADLEVELSRVEAAGGKVLVPKTPIGEYGFYGLISDTEGNTVGLHSMK